MRWDEVRWNETINHASRRLIRLRRELPALRYGSWESLFLFNGVCAYCRSYEGENVVVVLNPRDAQQDFALPIGAEHRTSWCDALNDKTYQARDGMLMIEDLPACSSLILIPVKGP
jgi:glycosidase